MGRAVTLPRVLNYHGSKYSLAPWILRFAPAHECFVDAFGGSGSIFCSKPPVSFEVYNDAGRDVSTFFRMLRERPAELAQVLALTPWSREEFALAWGPSEDPLERARRFVVRSWQSRGTAPATDGEKGRWKAGWRYQRCDSRGGIFADQWARLPAALLEFAQRMLLVQIESDHASRVIRRFDSPLTLTVADPPYLPDVRSKWASHAYEVEMTADHHVELAEVMHGLQGYGLVCGYPSALYRDLYEARGWVRREKRSLNVAGKRTVEALWVSPRTQVALAEHHGPLFAAREIQ